MIALEEINKKLVDYFGKFENNEPNWKLVWSEDVLEKRLMYYTPSGIELITPEVREVKKFNYIKDRYVLTKLVPVPEFQQSELCDAKLSYEPLWTFEDARGNAVEPYWDMIVILITTIYNAMNSAGHGAKYSMPEELMNTKEAMLERAKKLEEAMFGNETSLTDSLHLDSAVGFGERKRNDWRN